MGMTRKNARMLRCSDDFLLTPREDSAEYSPARQANAQALPMEETT
jgi:hypothetical protein